MQTEVHPLEYGKFAGTIPEGHYGAGEVRIFDDGWYEPIEWTDTKVSFRLHGRRYPGIEFHFVKTRTDWLAFLASNQTAPMIASPPRFQPMLAEGGWEPFDDPGWWFEPKFDGIRCLAELSTGQTVLRTRTGRDATAQYPEIHMIHELVDQVNAVIDGEIVAFDEDGKNSFEVLQQRMNLANPREIDRARKRIPVALVAFDLLWLDGRDTTALGLEERRELLDLVVEQDERLQIVTHVEGDGVALVDAARAQALEGVVAKRRGTPYVPGKRTDAWRKIKLQEHAGLRGPRLHARPGGPQRDVRRAPRGRVRRRRSLRWVGQVGSGFTDGMLTTVLDLLRPLVRPDPPIDDSGTGAGRRRGVRPAGGRRARSSSSR